MIEYAAAFFIVCAGVALVMWAVSSLRPRSDG